VSKKQLIRKIQLALALTFVMLAVGSCWQHKESMASQQVEGNTQQTIINTPKEYQREATLTDASQLYRICSSRTHRINSTNEAKTEKFNSTYNCSTRHKATKTLYSLHDSRRRIETAPFNTFASRDYYIIALRHIIR